jgi:hypothetical protein
VVEDPLVDACDAVVDELLKVCEFVSRDKEVNEAVVEDWNDVVGDDEAVDKVTNEVTDEPTELVVDMDVLRDELVKVSAAEVLDDIVIPLEDELEEVEVSDDVLVNGNTEFPVTEEDELVGEIKSVEELVGVATDEVGLSIADGDTVVDGRVARLDEDVGAIMQTACEMTF